MVDRTRLLADLRRLVTALEDDLRERSTKSPDVDAKLRAEWQSATQAKRTAESYVVWRDAFLTQVAAAWVLGTVFVRFLEDNRLIDEPWLSGPGERLQRAKDQRTLFFQQNPSLSDREYLHGVFRAMQALPAVHGLFDERHNPLWSAGLSGDGAAALLAFWQRVDPDTGHIAHDFADPRWDTRFLGDLYQDLSEEARKRYALLQTPEFVEEFILDRTLTPAIEEFGFREVRLLDPTCGSGHFVLGAFHRLYALWAKAEPETNPRELARRALAQVVGVDVNPYAVAIARFRLLIAALQVSGIEKMKDAPAFVLNVAAGDSLLHGLRFADTRGPTPDMFAADSIRHVYQVEDRDELARILGCRYHAVVGNPPYITVKDSALNQAYRDRFGSCHRKYSMAVPFMERFFELAMPGAEGAAAGYVGMITANSFMKREFGKKLIEEHIPRWDLTHVVDTSGAYIPGHGTPTVILYGRNQPPVASTIRTVMGIRGEPSTPEDPAQGLVWTAILDQIDRPGSEGEYVSVADTEREKFHSHPWSIGGGGAAELKEILDEAAEKTLADVVDVIGVFGMTNADDAMLAPIEAFTRSRVEPRAVRRLVLGDQIRDWSVAPGDHVLFPYGEDERLLNIQSLPGLARWLWPVRTVLGSRATFSKQTYFEEGRPWWEWHQVTLDRLRTPLSITFAFVATHNHFVLDRGGKVFKQSAPVIKLPPDATEDDHLAILGLLNSSLACFWMKQVFHNKGATSDTGVLQADPEKFRFEFDGTKLKSFPVPRLSEPLAARLRSLARALDALGRELQLDSFDHVIQSAASGGFDLRTELESLLTKRSAARCRMTRLQEELDWLVYQAFGLFEARQTGCDSLVWEIDVNELPPMERDARAYRMLDSSRASNVRGVETQRLELIRTNPDLALVERPDFKRRWHRSAGSYDERELTDDILVPRLQCEWLCARLEAMEMWRTPQLRSVAAAADLARNDPELRQVSELYRGRADFDVTASVAELIEGDAVPFLPALRYKPSGLRKREAWEHTWALQRREDTGEDVGEIPVPPKYTSADFLSGTYWRLRGKLDVPKERFILYPHCEREADPTPVIGWAGWDHLQQAYAVSRYYAQMRDHEGWPPQRLTPLLAGLLELEPWLLQWHNQLDPDYNNVRMGDYFRDYVREEARGLGLTIEEIRGWQPPARTQRRTRNNTRRKSR